jgi:hypothetical protein
MSKMGEALVDGRHWVISTRVPEFSNLPPEITNEIWRLVHQNPKPRVVMVRYDTEKGFSSKTALPASLSICRRSRFEAKKLFTPAFTSHYPLDADFSRGSFNTPTGTVEPKSYGISNCNSLWKSPQFQEFAQREDNFLWSIHPRSEIDILDSHVAAAAEQLPLPLDNSPGAQAKREEYGRVGHIVDPIAMSIVETLLLS